MGLRVDRRSRGADAPADRPDRRADARAARGRSGQRAWARGRRGHAGRRRAGRRTAAPSRPPRGLPFACNPLFCLDRRENGFPNISTTERICRTMRPAPGSRSCGGSRAGSPKRRSRFGEPARTKILRPASRRRSRAAAPSWRSAMMASRPGAGAGGLTRTRRAGFVGAIGIRVLRAAGTVRPTPSREQFGEAPEVNSGHRHSQTDGYALDDELER
jgi:hypothetical protein